MTREEKNAYQREWAKRNKDKIAEQNKKYREANKEKIRAGHKAWRDKNREKLNKKQREKYKENPDAFKERKDRYVASHIDQVKESRKRYKRENRQKCTEYQRNKRHSDLVYKFRSSFVHLIGSYREKTGYTGEKNTWQMVGCDFDFFLVHILNQLEDGMTLENYGAGTGKWSIDHIEPIRNAQNNEDVERINHYTNLRPLWNDENSRRGGETGKKPVYCVELDRVFDSISDAARELGLIQSSISACCIGRYKTTGGYHWKYVDRKTP